VKIAGQTIRLRSLQAVAALAATAGLAAAAPGSALAVPSAPSLRVTSQVQPSHLIRGNEAGVTTYEVVVTNVGGEATDGSPIVVTDNLPAGVTVSSAPTGPYGLQMGDDGEEGYPCVESPTPTCEAATALPPGGRLLMYLPVDVSASAPATAENVVTVSGGGAPDASTIERAEVTTTPAGPGFKSAGMALNAADGSPSTQAGSHPYRFETEFVVNSVGDGGFNLNPYGNPRVVSAKLPKGLVVDPSASPQRCTEAQFEASVESDCPDGSAIGMAHPNLGPFGISSPGFNAPLYNLVPPPGVAAEFGFNPNGFSLFIHILGDVNSAGEFELTAVTPEIPVFGTLGGLELELWGNPSDPSHDRRRGFCGFPAGYAKSCPTERIDSPLLSMPSSCSAQLPSAQLDMTTWQESDKVVSTKMFNPDSEGNPAGVDGCNKLEFSPTISAQPTTNVSDSPTGLDFNLHQPQAPKSEARTGQRLSCAPGSWSRFANPVTNFAYQWLRNGVPIAGANERQYTLGEEDEGTALQCEVAAENGAAGPGYAATAPIVVSPAPAIAPPAPAKPLLSTATGTPTTFGFKCDPGSWSGGPTFEFSWFENGTLVPGANGDTIQVPAEVGGESNKVTVQCEVTGTNAGGTVVAFSNNKSTPSAPSPELTEAESAPSIFIPEETIPLATANLKDAKVTLPQGMALNPSAGNGLAACDESQIGFLSGQPGIHFSEDPQTCPNGAKVGSAEVSTPLIDHVLPGAVYVAKPFDNPFGSFLAIYLVVEDELSGTVAKLAGKVVADPDTGQLTATFSENPELPIEDITLHFFNGPRAVLTSPLACGNHATNAELVPWSTPEGQTVNRSDGFATTLSPAGGCAGSEAAAPNAPTLSAGTLAPQAGAYSPFQLKLVRGDGTQRMTGIETTLPPGLVGKLTGIPYCSEGAIAAAKSREAPEQGKAEQAAPSCPLASEVGSVTVGAGAGISPFYVNGHAYLAGPYKGAPLSFVVITPAVAGPFDLGNVVVRVALFVNEYSAQIRAVSDPLPTIRQGIPLDVRSVALKIDRPTFTLNPTSCEVAAITASVTAATGQVAPLTNRFQVGGCKQLGFKPSFKLSLKGGTKRSSHPALKAVLTYPSSGAYANIARAQVGLPHSEFLDQANIKTVCTQVQLRAQACPAKSIYGHAKAWTPLLDKPVEGPVYLGTGFGHKLPDLVAELNGQIRVLVHGKVDTDKANGIRNTFEAVPDAPVSKFVLEMKGGPKQGLLVNSENICRKPQTAETAFTAQNGKFLKLATPIANSCKKGGGKKGAHGKKGKRGR